MRTKRDLFAEEEGFSLDSMLDIVFLLLIYFMVTAAFVKEEADISMSLPSRVEQDEPLDMPEEQVLDILGDGTILLNGQPFDTPTSPDMPQLTRTLTRFRQAAADAQVPAFIVVQPEDDARHQRIIDVLNACAVAKISLVSFNLE
ncbi:ExbD/TolR family protein [Synoicihabitans lomoniglobus]|uniref:Biopolymer transporter ExbD n=1 Tax=Synoicihabitans lomoniglobus TaxID=2909285 RepID=A0AAE9ZT66_9BACT|nr:biopolymer transporter ExbD [Opitutaceae bacterium LMO-M01]WED64740.1 biopolymer transporter ExbD [Opitutaceae bacterium LMO-M01]